MVAGNHNSREQVLVLDEDHTIRGTLEVLGIRVYYFSSAADCLAQLHSRRYDLLVMDLRTPEMSGLRLLEQVEKRIPWVPILFATKSDDIPTAVTAAKVGVVDVIEKPVKKADLIQKVRSILRQNHIEIPNAFKALSPNEMKVFRLIMEGNSNRKIAEMTKRHLKTIESQRASLMRKLGARNVIHLFNLGVTSGLVLLPTNWQSPQKRFWAMYVKERAKKLRQVRVRSQEQRLKADNRTFI